MMYIQKLESLVEILPTKWKYCKDTQMESNEAIRRRINQLMDRNRLSKRNNINRANKEKNDKENNNRSRMNIYISETILEWFY